MERSGSAPVIPRPQTKTAWMVRAASQNAPTRLPSRTDQHQPLPPEPVAECAGGQQQRGERDRVGVNNPGEDHHHRQTHRDDDQRRVRRRRRGIVDHALVGSADRQRGASLLS
jgi:hypothetical protein